MCPAGPIPAQEVPANTIEPAGRDAYLRFMNDIPRPPIAAQRPHQTIHHGRTLEDPWAWLRDPGYPDVTDQEVLDYLKAENAYFESHMAAKKPMVDALFAEMKARIKEEDRSVPQ